MKVSIFSSFYYPDIVGGGEISTQILAEGLEKKGIKIRVFTISNKNEIINFNKVELHRIKSTIRYNILQYSLPKNNKIKTYRVHLSKGLLKILDYIDVFFYFKLKKELKDSDIIHITNMWDYSGIPLIHRLSKNNKIKTIQTFRAPYLDYKNSILKKLNLFLYNLSLKDVNLVHSPSNFMLERTKMNGINVKESKVIYNTVDLKIKSPKYRTKKNQIVYVGNIASHKGIKTLIKSFEEIKNYKLLLIGSGELEKEIKDKYSHLNIEVTGWLEKEEVYRLIEESKVLVLPSEWDEAFGRVLVEGIYSGTLVIGSNRGAIPEVLDYRDKYTFKEKDSLELKNKIERILILSQNEYNLELSEMQKFMEKYSIENHINQFVELYDNLIKEN